MCIAYTLPPPSKKLKKIKNPICCMWYEQNTYSAPFEVVYQAIGLQHIVHGLNQHPFTRKMKTNPKGWFTPSDQSRKGREIGRVPSWLLIGSMVALIRWVSNTW